ncbi:MAG: hypothetical protein M1814_005321 [Vezdaea aestivalis]|nr:MAG: hypothetical protein M1814_005321 [Vezdaea aestivalis]
MANLTLTTPQNLYVFGGRAITAWSSSPFDHTSDPVVQESAVTGPNAADPQSTNPVPAVYSGDGLRKEADLSGASLAASAALIASFIGIKAVWGIGGRKPGSFRYGSTEGESTFGMSRSDALDYAVHVNMRYFWPSPTDPWKKYCEMTVNKTIESYPTS